MEKVYNIISRVMFIFLIGFLLISCESPITSKATSSYDKLCLIYQEVVTRSIDLSTKEGTLVQRVQSELPDFFNKNFVHIFKADADQRYGFIKKLAEEELKREWTCAVMKSYYDNEFYKPTKH